MHKHTKEHCNKRCKLKLGVESLHCKRTKNNTKTPKRK
jgi:hypothetical protein